MRSDWSEVRSERSGLACDRNRGALPRLRAVNGRNGAPANRRTPGRAKISARGHHSHFAGSTAPDLSHACASHRLGLIAFGYRLNPRHGTRTAQLKSGAHKCSVNSSCPARRDFRPTGLSLLISRSGTYRDKALRRVLHAVQQKHREESRTFLFLVA